ncbi:hypothetical protein Vi05172_g2227 [Venturia inaequalis]|nr:hypothetical protein Vi05172_g2227 [Venturia inaequalis]
MYALKLLTNPASYVGAVESEIAITSLWLRAEGGPTPLFITKDYIYATGKYNKDNKIGAHEMARNCKVQGAGQYCWSPGKAYNVNYKGDRVRNDSKLGSGTGV